MALIRTNHWPAGTRFPRLCVLESQTSRSQTMFASREGQRVPQVTFRIRAANEWKGVTTDDIFKGQTVVVFSLPGAFTPTCSSVHVPRYNELAPAFYANGVDKIVCVSVNDPFVMSEWAAAQEAGNVRSEERRVGKECRARWWP